MATRIGITTNGIKEECTVEEPYPCVRHVIHSSNAPLSKKTLNLELDEIQEDKSIVSFNDYASFNEHPNRDAIVEHLNKISETQGKMVETYTELLDKLEKSHDEGTRNLAKLHNMTVDEYKAWLDNEDRANGMWLDSNADDNDVLVAGKWATEHGDVVIIEAEGDEDGYGTTFTRYIGEKPFSKISVAKTFKIDDTDEIENLIKDSFPF